MSEDWLKKWYRGRFSQSSAEGLKDDVWKNINSKIENWSEFWYKSNSENIDVKPNPAVWENISAGLAVSSQKSISRHFWMRAASVAALFIFTPYFLSDLEIVETTSLSSNQVQLGSNIPSNSPLTSSATPETIGSNVISTGAIFQASLEPEFTPPTITKPVKVSTTGIAKVKSELKQEIDNQENYLATLFLSQPTNPIRDLNFDNRDVKPKKSLWSVGASLNIQQSNMINAVRINGISNQSNITNLFHTSYGINV